MKIPKIILDKAAEDGYNSVGYIGIRRGAHAFSVGVVSEDGTPTPTGLPTVYLLRGDHVTEVYGFEAFDLL